VTPVAGTTLARPPAAAGPRPEARTQTLYAALAREVHAHGLTNRRYGYYAARGAVTLAVVAGAVTAHVLLGPTWWQLAVAGVLGLALTQVAFLTHDAGHRQIFASARHNEWAARILATGVVGMAYGWWNTKHSRHHGAPNQIDKDTDIEPGVLAWTPEQSDARRGLPAWFAARQGWLFFPLLTLEGVNLHAAGLRAIVSGAPMKRRWLELGLIVARLGGFLALVLVVLPPGMAAAFVGVQLAVFGVSIGATFAPNHKGMPLVPRGLTVDFLRRQVLMSRNIRGGWLVDTFMGGLNYQIEHHLFPHMPRPSLRRAAPLVRAFCERHGVAYTETGLLQSYGIVVRYLNQVGLGSRDPFVCPLVQVYRPV
jgi:fatty acid desaturase